MGHAKEFITIDVYGDTAEIIEDCLNELQPFIEDVMPEPDTEKAQISRRQLYRVSGADFGIMRKKR